MNHDRSVSIALINRGPERAVAVDCTSWKSRVDGTPSFHQPLREYVYQVGKVPYSPFNDLQPASGKIDAKDGAFSVKLPAKSIVFLTTDYVDRKPAAIADVRLDGGVLRWAESDDKEHRYYRVYRDGKQIASTVATSLDLGGRVSSRVEAAGGVSPERSKPRKRSLEICSPPETDAMNCVPTVFDVRSVDKWGNEGLE